MNAASAPLLIGIAQLNPTIGDLDGNREVNLSEADPQRFHASASPPYCIIGDFEAGEKGWRNAATRRPF